MSITTAQQAAQILNESLVKLGQQYQIDTTDGTTIENGIRAIGVWSPSAVRSVLEQMVTILKYRNYGVMFESSKNPTRRFWRDAINQGGGEADIFHHIIESEQGFWADDFANLDDEASKALASDIAIDLVEYKKNTISKKFHTDYVNFRIKTSRSDLLISELFTTQGMIRFIDVVMANMQWSAEVKLQDIAIGIVKDMVEQQHVVFFEGNNLNTENGVTTMVEQLKTVSDGMTNISDAFNSDGVINMSAFDDLYLVTTPEFVNRISVRGYANAYNLEEYRANNRILTLPYGTDLGTSPTGQKVYAVLVDRRSIVMALRYWDLMPFYPSNTDYVNFFLKVRMIKGHNEFFNAVAFCGDDIANFNEGGTTIVELRGSDTVEGYYFNGIAAENYVQHVDVDGVILSVPAGALLEASDLPGLSNITIDNRIINIAATTEITLTLPTYATVVVLAP